MLSQQSRDAEEQMRTAFKVFDIDSNGFIDTAELRSTLAELGSSVSLPDAEALLRSADKNGDGQIDYEGKSTVTDAGPEAHDTRYWYQTNLVLIPECMTDYQSFWCKIPVPVTWRENLDSMPYIGLTAVLCL